MPCDENAFSTQLSHPFDCFAKETTKSRAFVCVLRRRRQKQEICAEKLKTFRAEICAEKLNNFKI